jgi:hypothetical protein
MRRDAGGPVRRLLPAAGAAYKIAHVMADPTKRRERLRASVLMLERGSEFELLPLTTSR